MAASNKYNMPSRDKNDLRFNHDENNAGKTINYSSSQRQPPVGSETQTPSRLNRRRLVRKKPRQRGRAVSGAQNQLKRFRQGSILAVAVTAFLLILLTPGEAGYTQDGQSVDSVQTSSGVKDIQPGEEIPDTVAIIEHIAVEDLLTTEVAADEDSIQLEEGISKAAKNEAITTLRNLWDSFYSNLPKLLVALGTLLFAWLLVRLIRFILRRTLKRWSSSRAVITIIAICVWLFAIGVAISVVAGDIRALVGSLGLIGLALSWALQTPIESFTGWLLNSFRGYYRVGDRISVGDIVGDVYKIDFLTTTVWEIGAPYRQGFVYAEQPTGRMVTFPNNEILSGAVVNMTGDFPFVWDELAVGVANESDIRLSMQVMEKVARNLLGDYMKEPSDKYEKILRRAGLEHEISEKPQVYIALRDSWTDVIIRYLVGARERRKWKSELSLLINEELSKPEYKGKIIGVYPRRQVQIIDSDGMPDEMKKPDE